MAVTAGDERQTLITLYADLGSWVEYSVDDQVINLQAKILIQFQLVKVSKKKEGSVSQVQCAVVCTCSLC